MNDRFAPCPPCGRNAAAGRPHALPAVGAGAGSGCGRARERAAAADAALARRLVQRGGGVRRRHALSLPAGGRAVGARPGLALPAGGRARPERGGRSARPMRGATPAGTADRGGRPILYELHVGAGGGFARVGQSLPRLQRLGVTALELMPVNDFPGRRNWGYDGVLPYAPDSALRHAGGSEGAGRRGARRSA